MNHTPLSPRIARARMIVAISVIVSVTLLTGKLVWYCLNEPAREQEAMYELQRSRGEVQFRYSGNGRTVNEVEFWGGELTRQNLQPIHRLRNARSVTFRFCTFSADALSELDTIRSLHFFLCKLTRENLESMAQLRSLHTLDLDNCDMAIDSLALLKEFVSLRTLHVTQYEGAGITFIDGLRILDELELCGFELSEADMECVARLTSLRRLHVFNPRGGFTNNRLRLLTRLEHLYELYLVQAYDITDEGLVHVAALRNLGTLVLRKTGVTDAGMRYLHGLKQLRYLDVVGTEVTEQGVAELEKAIPGLKVSWGSS